MGDGKHLSYFMSFTINHKQGVYGGHLRTGYGSSTCSATDSTPPCDVHCEMVTNIARKYNVEDKCIHPIAFNRI